ncbi:MAG: 50S ribosomal protein L18 [Candidatus Omnitrophota bacterium]
MDKKKKVLRRKKSIRKKVSGTSDRPRMAISKSNRNIYVQVIDDVVGKTVCGASTRIAGEKSDTVTRKNIECAGGLGVKIAKEAMGKGIKKVVFDRAGYKYHGTVKALAEGARKEGLEF